MNDISKCEYCDKNHDGVYASGRFCSRKCASGSATRYQRSKINEKVSKKLKNKPFPKAAYERSLEVRKTKSQKLKEFVCEKCNNTFMKKSFRKGRKIHCDVCKRKTPYKEIQSILELSSRTVRKLIKRGNRKCIICEWDICEPDIHHIVPKNEGGTNDHSNLICLCPNCHRMAHNNLYERDMLLERAISITFTDWKDFYVDIFNV
jgi:predicted HNH restriction endonuclease